MNGWTPSFAIFNGVYPVVHRIFKKRKKRGRV